MTLQTKIPADDDDAIKQAADMRRRAVSGRFNKASAKENQT